MDRLRQAEIIEGGGRGALIAGLAGWGWILWGLFAGQAFTPTYGIVLLCVEILLLCGAVLCMVKGRKLRRQVPSLPVSVRRNTRNWFLLVLAAEIGAIMIVVVIARSLHRIDLAIVWIAMIVGIHFLPLARIFRARALGVIGVLITIWCLVSWGLFRSSAVAISAAIGTGILLWVASAQALIRAYQAARSLRQ